MLYAGALLNQAVGAVILLHGRGASAGDILNLAEVFYDRRLAFLAPEAAGHAWYPQSFLAPRQQNEPGVSSALARIASLITQITTAGIPLNRIAICGFSQGACLATEFVASHPARYGALIAYTGGLIGAPGEVRHHAGQLEGLPAFLGSGDPDPHVPWARVEESAQVLRQMGAAVATERYPGRPHTISHPELVIGKQMVLGMLDASSS